LDIEDRIGQISLGEDRLLVPEFDDFSSHAGVTKEAGGIEHRSFRSGHKKSEN